MTLHPSLHRITHLLPLYVDGRLRRQEIVPITGATLKSNLVQVAHAMGDPSAHLVARWDVDQWMENANLARSTVRTRLSQLRGFFQWAIREGYAEVDPTAGIKGPKQPRQIPRGMKRAETKRLLAVCPDARAVVIVLLTLQEGLRRKEVAGLQLEDIDWAERSLFIRGKGNNERIVALSEETEEAIGRYLDTNPATAGPLIRSYLDDGRAPLSATGVGRLYSDWLYLAGVKKRAYDGRSMHAGRHTCATDMLRHGAHVRDVQAAMGHASMATTQRYLPWLVKDLRSAMGGRSYLDEDEGGLADAS